ncbi:efflux RND transporter periplasmic adaptor subunit, partial [candidate division KSB1 bacterium]|nr:efflux RND transporter periplasmic adaptor subunit [candidate division KSB1 bacterium]
MKKLIISSLVAAFIAGCGSESPSDKLEKLQAERDRIEAQIEQLKQQIAAENGDTLSKDLTPVIVEKITPQSFEHIINVQGTVESDNNIMIPAQYSGIVKKIHVTEGQSVKEGQLLAELDGAILENTLAELEVNLELAKTVFERQSRLWEKEIGSEVQYLQARTNMEALEKRLAATREQYKLTKITSPIDGNVDEVMLKQGEAVAAGFPTIRVVRLSELKIAAHLSEEYIGQVKAGQPVTVRLPVLNKKFDSTISTVSQVIDPQNRTFLIEVLLPAQDEAIQPNSLAVLSIANYRTSDALTVPVDVLQRTEDRQFLFTAQANSESQNPSWTVAKVWVETGYRANNQVEILNGLESGDHIVV